MYSYNSNLVPLAGVKVQRYGDRGRMITLSKDIWKPRNIDIGDTLQGYLDPENNRLIFDLPPPVVNNGLNRSSIDEGQ